MKALDRIGVISANLAAAALGALLFKALGLPLATILGSLTGAALAANLVGAMPGGRQLRRGSQLFVGVSIGHLLSPATLDELARLFPVMLAVTFGSALAGAALASPIARLARLDRLSALLACLPAGMAEMASLAREVGADEQSVTVIHTLRVILVVSFIPLWLGLTGRPSSGLAPTSPSTMADLCLIAVLLLISLVVAVIATRLRLINAFVIAPMLLCLAFVAVGYDLPPVPRPILALAEIGIGASLGMRFRIDRLRKIPRVALGGVVSGAIMIAIALTVLSGAVELATNLDHLSAILATAPGGLGEMVASAGALGVLVAAVAGFQLTRAVFTNLFIAPAIRWAAHRQAARRSANTK